MGDWFDWFVTRIGDIFTYLNTTYLLPGVSLLGIMVFFSITCMITNVFVGRGKE